MARQGLADLRPVLFLGGAAQGPSGSDTSELGHEKKGVCATKLRVISAFFGGTSPLQVGLDSKPEPQPKPHRVHSGYHMTTESPLALLYSDQSVRSPGAELKTKGALHCLAAQTVVASGLGLS